MENARPSLPGKSCQRERHRAKKKTRRGKQSTTANNMPNADKRTTTKTGKGPAGATRKAAASTFGHIRLGFLAGLAAAGEGHHVAGQPVHSGGTGKFGRGRCR